ncbi:early nodulin-like protein 7 [Prunus dulcis]|uniref:Early nodulin-like protein 7 n=1 Tax=Prunus dulcis TaxID=3755 RepID=A0A4Y1QT23_PRUDU|nr:early nodulin-like protein 7 [Prunus dulcis]
MESPPFGSFPTSWLGGSHGSFVFVAGHALEAVDFWLGGELQIQPQLWHREISFFPHPSTEAAIFLAYESLHRCSPGFGAGPANIFTHILVFTSIFYTVKQSIGCLEQHSICVYMSEKDKKKGKGDSTIPSIPNISLSHVQTETESEKMVTTKSMEEIVSDFDLPIIGLKKKSSMENLPTSTSTPKIEVKTSIKEKKIMKKVQNKARPIK